MKQSIKLWSYNLFLRPPPIKNNEDDFKAERFELIMDIMQNYDICCFQELFQTATFRSEDLIIKATQKGTIILIEDFIIGKSVSRQASLVANLLTQVSQLFQNILS